MKLTIYMKSGNRIAIRQVKEYEIEYRGNEVVGLSVKSGWFARTRLIVPSVALDQIEAITRS